MFHNLLTTRILIKSPSFTNVAKRLCSLSRGSKPQDAASECQKKLCIRHNFHEECETGLNDQINSELFASYTYFYMVCVKTIRFLYLFTVLLLACKTLKSCVSLTEAQEMTFL